MARYYGIVHKDEDSAWSVHFPEISGCFSAADAEEDLLKNSMEALRIHLEGEGVPEERGITWVRQQAAEDLAAGAYIVSVPYIRNTAEPVRVNISVDRGTLNAIDAFSSELGLTRSAFMVQSSLRAIRQAGQPEQDG